jgi:peroxiredoxin
MYLRNHGRRRYLNNVKCEQSVGVAAAAGSMGRRKPAHRVRVGLWRALAGSVVCTLLWNASALAADRDAPDFVLPAANGSNVRLSEHRGDVVLLLFWSSHCSTCAAQLSALDALDGTYQSAGLTTLAVSVDDEPARALAYAQEHRTHFPLLLDRSKQVGRAFGVVQLPTLVLIDRSGAVRYMNSDPSRDQSSLVREVRTLLDDQVGPLDRVGS